MSDAQRTESSGPFAIGDHVLVYDDTGCICLDKGVIDGEQPPHEGDDGQWSYDVRGEHRWDGLPEMNLSTTSAAA